MATNVTRFLAALVLALALASIGLAQDAKPAPYTEVEALRLQNVQLEGQIVARSVADWQAKVKALKADLEKARPGWIFTTETGEWAKAPEVPK